MAQVRAVATRIRRSASRSCVFALALLAACAGSALDRREQQIVQLYLLCYDCGSPLDSVRAIALRQPTAIVDSLNRALVVGPGASPASDSAFGLAFIQDSTYSAVHHRSPLPTNRAEYVLVNHQRYDQGYQSRAAVGLGWIHNARAISDLKAALASRLPTSVLQAVRFALDSLP